MEFFNFLVQHWFDFLQTAGIIGGLFFTGLSFRDNFQARQVATLIELTSSHRDIWENLFTHTELTRIAKREVDLVRLEGIHTDIEQFFAAPIPSAVWTELREFQNRDFVRFVESHF